MEWGIPSVDTLCRLPLNERARQAHTPNQPKPPIQLPTPNCISAMRRLIANRLISLKTQKASATG
jgi:hypothetical protein